MRMVLKTRKKSNGVLRLFGDNYVNFRGFNQMAFFVFSVCKIESYLV